MSDPLSHWPARTTLKGADGTTALIYSPGESTRNGRPWADGVWRPGDVPVDAAVDVSLRQLGGYAVSTSDAELVDGLVAAGAETLRHAHVMAHDLATVPDPPSVEGLSIHGIGPQQVARHAARLGELNLAAYPVDHPDHEHETVDAAAGEMLAVSRGELLGPVLPVSQVAVSRHTLIGAALIVDRPGNTPEGGPWVLDIFRDPAAPVKGVGRALLVAVLVAAKETGLPSVTLVVSHTNANARALYGALGFVDHEQSWTLGLPTAG